MDPGLIASAGSAIVSAIRSASEEGDHHAAMTLGRSADAAVSLSGRCGVWGQVLEATRDASVAGADQFTEGWSLHQHGTLALAEQRNDSALEMLTHAADIRRQIGDQAGLKVTEHNLSLPSPAPPVAPPDPPRSTPPSSNGMPWWAWTMIVAGLLAVAGIVGFVALSQDPEPTVVTTIATQAGELVTTTDSIEILDVPLGESVSSEVELINTDFGVVALGEHASRIIEITNAGNIEVTDAPTDRTSDALATRPRPSIR